MLDPSSATLWDLGFHRFKKWEDTSHREVYESQLLKIINQFFSLKHFSERIDMRTPVRHFYLDDAVCRFHHDLSDADSPPFPGWLTLWTNRNGTEIIRNNGRQVYQCLSGHVYLLDNTAWKHRTPVLTTLDYSGRYFLRGYASMERQEGIYGSKCQGQVLKPLDNQLEKV